MLLIKLNIYSKFGINDFILALGYKGEFIKDYFINFPVDFKNSLKNAKELIFEHINISGDK